MNTILERTKNPIYKKVEAWFEKQGIVTANPYNFKENEVFYYALQAEFPGISNEITDIFFDIAKQIISG